MFHFHTRFCSFLKLFFWNDRRPGRRHTVLQKDSSNSCCWYKLILYYNILSTVYIFNLKTISASSSYFKNHVYFFIPYYWQYVVWLSVTLVSKMKKVLFSLTLYFLHVLCVFFLHFHHPLSLPLSWSLVSLSHRGKAEFGPERVGGHSCRHGSFKTFLPWATWAPGAVRLLYWHRGDSQWVNVFIPTRTGGEIECDSNFQLSAASVLSLN